MEKIKIKNTFNRFKNFLKDYDYQWKFKLFFVVPFVIVLVVFDWITKGVVSSSMIQGETKPFIPNFLSLEFYINLGSAYGKNDNAEQLWKTITLASFITFFVLIILIFLNSKKWLFPIALLFAGSFANLLGRAWAPGKIEIAGQLVYGGVVDMFRFEFSFLGSDGYIFNLADLWVSASIGVGIICFIWELVLIFTTKNNDKNDGNEESGKKNENLN